MNRQYRGMLIYPTPLDRVMEDCQSRHGIKYQRFMDYFVIFASSRHKSRIDRGCYRL